MYLNKIEKYLIFFHISVGIIFQMSYKIIFSFLEPVSEKWPEILIALCMSEEARHRISEASSTSSILCCSRMVEEWLMGSGRRPSWYDLTEALRSLLTWTNWQMKCCCIGVRKY